MYCLDSLLLSHPNNTVVECFEGAQPLDFGFILATNKITFKIEGNLKIKVYQ